MKFPIRRVAYDADKKFCKRVLLATPYGVMCITNMPSKYAANHFRYSHYDYHRLYANTTLGLSHRINHGEQLKIPEFEMSPIRGLYRIRIGGKFELVILLPYIAKASPGEWEITDGGHNNGIEKAKKKNAIKTVCYVSWALRMHNNIAIIDMAISGFIYRCDDECALNSRSRSEG